jgi:predicted nucleic acid-binding protein
MAGVSFDTGVLIALERDDQTAWGWMRRAAERRIPPLVSTAAIAEAWRGGRPRLSRALEGCEIVPVSESLARAAGVAVGEIGAGTIDAIIAATAAVHGAALLTGDVDDMRALAEHFRSLRVLSL